MSAAQKRTVVLTVGGESRAELLPPEVSARAAARGTQRALVGVVVVAALISAGGFGFASIVAGTSAQRLAAEQQRSSELVAKQSEFIEVRLTQQKLDTASAALEIGASTEIGWEGYLGDIRTAMGPDVALSGVAFEGSTPLQGYAAPTAPLQKARAGTLILAATTPTVPNTEKWLRALEGVAGFADASASSIEWDEQLGYKVTITMHVNGDAYSHRFGQTETDSTEDGQ
ncbi:MAG: hypothetical protein RI885_472 [Actinomycetota bacterium]|jgi:Tfp pilus assembly protein PilN